jgi:hypothetical protein
LAGGGPRAVRIAIAVLSDAPASGNYVSVRVVGAIRLFRVPSSGFVLILDPRRLTRLPLFCDDTPGGRKRVLPAGKPFGIDIAQPIGPAAIMLDNPVM